MKRGGTGRLFFFQQNHPFYTRGELQTPAAAVWSWSFRSFTQQEFWSYDSVSFCGFLFFSSLFYKRVLSLAQTYNNVFLQFAYCGLEAASLWKNTRTPASLSSCCESLPRLSTVPAQEKKKKNGLEGSRMPVRVFSNRAFRVVVFLRCFLTELPSKTCGLRVQFCAYLVWVIGKRSCRCQMRPAYHLWFRSRI